VEEWCKIDGFDGYEVSNKGGVRSFFRQSGWGKWEISDDAQRELSLSEDDDGYLCVALRHGGRTHYLRVHRLVANAFLGLCPEGYVVSHGDNDKQNNSVGNLSYATQKENLNNGYGVSTSRLTAEEVKKIRKLAANGWNDKEIMTEMEVNRQVVSCCRRGYTYKWVGGPITKRRPGCSDAKTSPTDENVRQMRIEAHEGKETLSKIADRYSVSLSYLSKVVRGWVREDAGGPVSDPRSKHFEERMKLHSQHFE